MKVEKKMKKTIVLNGSSFECEEIKKDKNILSFVFRGKKYSFEIDKNQENVYLKDSHGNQTQGLVSGDLIWIDGMRFEKQSSRKKRRGVQEASAGGLLSPMPGKILKVMVASGDQVTKGQALLVMEAMKMEHTLKAPYDGLVSKLPYKVGDQVQGGEELLILEESP